MTKAQTPQLSFACSDILVLYGEIALKGKNRPIFVNRLKENIRKTLGGLPLASIRHDSGRLWLSAKGDERFGPETFSRLATVYGIASYAPALKVALDLRAMKEGAVQLVDGRTYQSFRVTSRRAFKDLPYPSMEVNREVGSHLYEHRAAKVQMKGADLELFIDMVPGGAYLYVDKIPGLGGLPVGVTGKVCVLLSGGIDSPVAAFRMMRRGCRALFVHFHSHPLTSKASLEKAEDLAEQLSKFQNESTLYSVAFGRCQQAIVENAPGKLRVILYRRLMVRIAAAIAQKTGAKVLVTGESLAQVASQTLANMVVIEDASPLTILRPLVGFDKQEIVTQAIELGSYTTSIQPDQDCCSLFVPKSPETRARLPEVLAAEDRLSVETLIAQALDTTECLKIQAPWGKHSKGKEGRTRSPKQVFLETAALETRTSTPSDRLHSGP